MLQAMSGLYGNLKSRTEGRQVFPEAEADQVQAESNAGKRAIDKVLEGAA